VKPVKYVGEKRMGIRKGALALMNDQGLVQLDGPKDLWRYGPDAMKYYPLCFGWHDCGTDWEVK
jgi:hypothetical protein